MNKTSIPPVYNNTSVHISHDPEKSKDKILKNSLKMTKSNAKNRGLDRGKISIAVALTIK